MSEMKAERRIDEESALRAIVEATASETGEAFYRALVSNLAKALDTQGAWVTEYFPETKSVRTLAFRFGDQFVENFEYFVAGTPCETLVAEKQLVHVPDRIIDLYPAGPPQGFPGRAVSYLGMPLLDTDNRVMGHMSVVDGRPMPDQKRLITLFQIFARRAEAEMHRLRLEAELRDGKQKLGRLIDSAMDAIVELDGQLEITMMNPAAEKAFSCKGDKVCHSKIERMVGAESMRKLRGLATQLDERTGDERYLWIPGGLTAEPDQGRSFHAEATLSRFEVDGRPFYTLIMRDVDERLEAERKIRTLSAQTEYLQEELEAGHGFDEIIGNSESLRVALKSVEQVAVTDATVLIVGETGTGKELFARAIHHRSARKDKPLIKVNCAAIPANLMESEFFGHERGAFTGATQRREGRFTLADGGTIFLDEVGELPIDLQGKLLRVLQEGEFEPVGGSHTHKVDVRVLAATNRSLRRAVKAGEFREDLYYRLNVFPIRLPPLRERGDDVVLIANSVIEKLSRSMGKAIEPIADVDAFTLRTYPWPGNVRELRNVVERALITTTGSTLDLQTVLPGETTGQFLAPVAVAPPADEVMTDKQVKEIERKNMIAALEKCGWRVAGDNGAAELLGLSPSTLKSRMKALAIERPRT